MFQNVVSILSQLGLKDQDAKVYLALLHFKEGLYTHEIVKQTRFKRSSVDLIIGRLLHDHYIHRVLMGKRYKYIAKAPETILFQKQEALAAFEDALPVLSRLGGNQDETRVHVFEGKDSLRRIHEDILLSLKHTDDEKKELLSFSSGADLIRVFPDIQKTFIQKRVKLGAAYKAIAPKSSKKVPEWVSNASEHREVRHIESNQFVFRASFDVYADKVMMYSPQKPVGGVVIDNPKIAESMRSLFYFVWGALKPS